MPIEMEILSQQDKEEMTEEERELSMAIFGVSAPVIPMLMDELQKLDSSINGAVLVCWRPDGSVAVVTGNSPPSSTVPILQKVLGDLMGVDKEFIEDAFAKAKSKAN